MFKGRKLIIATKHHKEKVLAPLLEEALGVECFTSHNFDTDTLGTFSGEVERKQDPIATARQKCLLAMEESNCDLGVASEGSFGPHPSIYFASADDEFLLFIDKKNDLEIIARALSVETNFNAKEIENEQQLIAFAKAAQFPSHALILRKSKTDVTNIKKGITNLAELKSTFATLSSINGKAYVETDMRAMYNPSRMRVIENAAKKLVAKINNNCPHCKTPGFDVLEVKKGLPCGLCGLATRGVLSHMYKCAKCNFTEEKSYPNDKMAEDPTFCDFCNP